MSVLGRVKAAGRTLFGFGVPGASLQPRRDVVGSRWGSGAGSRFETVPAAYAAVNLLTSAICGLPKVVVRQGSSGPLDLFDEQVPHQVSLLLNNPSPQINGWQFWEVVLCELFATGNSYVIIERDADSQLPIGLMPAVCIEARRTISEGGTLYRLLMPWYAEEFDRREARWYASADYIGLHLLGFDGYESPSPVGAVQNNLDVMKQSSKRSQEMLSKSLQSPLAFIADSAVTGKTSPDRAKALKLEMEEQAADIRSNNAVVLPAGYDVKPMPSFTAVDLELLRLQNWGVEEIARAWNVPIQLLQSGAPKNLSELSEAFQRYSVLPHTQRIQSELTVKLLGRASRQGFRKLQVKFMTSRLGQQSTGDLLRSVGQAVAVDSVCTPNEGRQFLGLPPIAGCDGLLPPRGTTQPPMNMENSGGSTT